MILFNLSLKPYLKSETLFFRSINGPVYNEEIEGIEMPSNSSICFDTYYNLLSGKFFEYAKINELKVNINFIGEISLEIHIKTNSKDVLLEKKEFKSKVRKTCSLSLGNISFEEDGFLYLAINALDTSVVYEGNFEVGDNDINNVKIGIVICTFKREQYLLKNIDALNEYIETHKGFIDKIGIFVVDNGKTLSKDTLPDYVNLIPNENTGGSGGFTRGLVEVLKNEEYTHFLFMDDDITFVPEIINKTHSLLSLLKDEYKESSISGSMLIIDKPTIQHELGGKWDGAYNSANGEGRDLSKIEDLLKNEDYAKADYGAWWYMCMPVQNAKKYGLPLNRLFIKCDDIEYGLRAAKGMILINGIGVWHESFEHKYSPAFEYFIKRNELITNSRFPRKKGFWCSWIKLVRAISRAIIEQRYYTIDIIEKAYLDFLKGSSYYFKMDLLDTIKKLNDKCPKQIPVDAKELDYFNEELLKSKDETNRGLIQVLNLNSYLIPKCFYKKKPQVVSMVKPNPTNFYKANIVIHYNQYTGNYFKTKIKKRMLFYGLWKIIKVSVVMMFKYHFAKKRFKKI